MTSKYENIFEYLVDGFADEENKDDPEYEVCNMQCECCGEILYDTILITNKISGIIYDACRVFDSANILPDHTLISFLSSERR